MGKPNLEHVTYHVWCEVRDFVFMFPAFDAQSRREARQQAEAAFGDMGFEDQPEVICVAKRKAKTK